ncbi:hypothetical protein San01_24410 [Streptomyces angustmyceticus]|uniref:Uncharacterized protein n=1 Tax=Streptomyces angustmyceticus TaxID=285578 RepID=A0A5J4LBF8_9ACTN|nr:hypothetical protein San01_24410 [Streptomyces angustmyceticus]
MIAPEEALLARAMPVNAPPPVRTAATASTRAADALTAVARDLRCGAPGGAVPESARRSFVR